MGILIHTISYRLQLGALQMHQRNPKEGRLISLFIFLEEKKLLISLSLYGAKRHKFPKGVILAWHLMSAAVEWIQGD